MFKLKKAASRGHHSAASPRAPKGPQDIPTISEEQGVRYLHLGTPWIQGAMRIRNPNALVLSYTQQMMAWLLFLEPRAQDTVGILGLGAGSLLRYTLAQTPAQLRTVECNAQVTALCRAYFRLPDTPRSLVEHDDAQDWIRAPAQAGAFLALMVDLYDAQAQGPVCDSLEFYRGCYRALGDVGVMTVNLFGRHASYGRNLERMREAFAGRVLCLPEVDEGNVVALAFKGPLLDVSRGQFLDRSIEVHERYGLPARQWARSLLGGAGLRSSVTI